MDGTDIQKYAFDMILNWYWGQDYAGDADELSAKWVGDEYAFYGPEHIFPGGYKQIVDVIANGLDITFSQVVTAIDY